MDLLEILGCEEGDFGFGRLVFVCYNDEGGQIYCLARC